jgi:hypothetical protein
MYSPDAPRRHMSGQLNGLLTGYPDGHRVGMSLLFIVHQRVVSVLKRSTVFRSVLLADST